jgi:hypothetical protein
MNSFSNGPLNLATTNFSRLEMETEWASATFAFWEKLWQLRLA